MKLVCHLVILLLSFCAFTSRSFGQENNKGAGRAGLSITATAKPASIIALTANSNNLAVSETNSTSAGTVRVTLQNPDGADPVRQTPEGTLFLNRIEIFVRFSGYKYETATVLISVTNGEAVREGASPEVLERILPNQLIEVRGVRSGDRIVRYVGFLVGGDVKRPAGKEPLEAVLSYQISAP